MKNRNQIDLVADVQASLSAVEAMPPEQRARTAHALWPQVLDIQAQIAGLRRSGVRGLRAQGLSLASIGEVLGMSVSRVKQIERGLERKRKEDSDPA